MVIYPLLYINSKTLCLFHYPGPGCSPGPRGGPGARAGSPCCGWPDIHIYIYIYMYICIHTYTYVYIYIYIYIVLNDNISDRIQYTVI